MSMTDSELAAIREKFERLDWSGDRKTVRALLAEVERWKRIAQRIDDDADTVRENLERERDEALTEVERLEAQPEHYTSTACQHHVHAECRRECKFCQRPCRCECHRPEHWPATSRRGSTDA